MGANGSERSCSLLWCWNCGVERDPRFRLQTFSIRDRLLAMARRVRRGSSSGISLLDALRLAAALRGWLGASSSDAAAQIRDEQKDHHADQADVLLDA